MASETIEHVIVDFANSSISNNNTAISSTKFRWDKRTKSGTLDKMFSKLQGQKEFSNRDFNADKIQYYEKFRKGMACIYEHQPSCFRLDLLNSDVSSYELKISKDLIKKGYLRVHEKIKELRQNFQNILAGRRSGSAKISD